jgi:hypothetical protein
MLLFSSLNLGLSVGVTVGSSLPSTRFCFYSSTSLLEIRYSKGRGKVLMVSFSALRQTTTVHNYAFFFFLPTQKPMEKSGMGTLAGLPLRESINATLQTQQSQIQDVLPDVSFLLLPKNYAKALCSNSLPPETEDKQSVIETPSACFSPSTPTPHSSSHFQRPQWYGNGSALAPLSLKRRRTTMSCSFPPPNSRNAERPGMESAHLSLSPSTNLALFLFSNTLPQPQIQNAQRKKLWFCYALLPKRKKQDENGCLLFDELSKGMKEVEMLCSPSVDLKKARKEWYADWYYFFPRSDPLLLFFDTTSRPQSPTCRIQVAYSSAPPFSHQSLEAMNS